MNRLKVHRVNVNGELNKGVYAKDVILRIIHDLGIKGGIGNAYEYAGSVIDNMGMEGRMTVCNMSIEGGARIGYVNPDQTTFDYLEGREFTPKGEDFERAKEYWKSIASDDRCRIRSGDGHRWRDHRADGDMGYQPRVMPPESRKNSPI